MGQICSGTRSPPGAVSRSRKREQQAARSNRSECLVSVPVTPQWCAQEAAGPSCAYTSLLVANIMSRGIMKVCSMLLAAVSAPRV